MGSRDAERRALGMLGLAAKAGRVIAGVPLICIALQKHAKGKTPLIVLSAADASPNTKKRIGDRTAFYGVPHYPLTADCVTLALSVGKRECAVAAVAVTEEGLAKAIGTILQESGQ